MDSTFHWTFLGHDCHHVCSVAQRWTISSSSDDLIDLLKSLVAGLNKLISKTSITSGKCTCISQNLSGHLKRSPRHTLILLPSYVIFFCILHLYAHILILGFFFQLVRAIGEARAQDTNILCYEVPKFIPLNYKTDSIMPPITGRWEEWPRILSSGHWKTFMPFEIPQSFRLWSYVSTVWVFGHFFLFFFNLL